MTKKRNIIIYLLISLIGNHVYAQDKNVDFGLKGGIDFFNYSTVDPNRPNFFQFTERIDKEVGFFLGGYSSIDLNKSLSLQSELLFRLHSRREIIALLEIRLPNGIIIRNGFPTEVKVTDFILQVPIIAKYEIVPNLQLGLGPQFALILDRKISFSKNSIDQNMGNEIVTDFNSDNFDLGLVVRASYKLTNKFGIFTGYNYGFIERDNKYNSSVIDFGINVSLL